MRAIPRLPDRGVDGQPPLSVPAAIAQRRATRHFDPSRPVPLEVLKQILHLARLAPSGYNLQPWRMIVVRSERNRQKLRACAFGQAKITEAPVVLIVLGYHNPHLTDLGAAVSLQQELGVYSAETAAAVRATARRTLERVLDPAVWATRSTMLAAGTLMLAAESLGVASAPMEGFDAAKVKEAFGVPDDHTICCLIALGFPTDHKPFPGRFDLDHFCYEEHFGQPWTHGDVDATPNAGTA